MEERHTYMYAGGGGGWVGGVGSVFDFLRAVPCRPGFLFISFSWYIFILAERTVYFSLDFVRPDMWSREARRGR